MIQRDSITQGHRRLTGNRIVALFEAAKGLVVVIAGFGLLASIDTGAQRTAEALVRHAHLNPARRFPRIFLEAAAHVSDRQLMTFASLALLYALVRLIEAYGLFTDRRWAEWLAALSGAIYLPYEVAELLKGVTPLRVTTFLVNLGIVGFMAWQLVRRRTVGATRA